MSTQSIAILALCISTASQAINFGLLIKKVLGKRAAQAEARLRHRKLPQPNPRIIPLEDVKEIHLK